MSLENWQVGELLDKLGGQDPSAGGGTASLVTAAQGASLLAKAAAVTQKKEPIPRLEELRLEAVSLGRRLTHLAQADGEAYAAVVAAYGLPKGEERTAQIQVALERAAQTPLEAADLCRSLWQKADEFLALSKKSIHTDVAAGALLLWTGMRGCLLNALVNAQLMSDKAHAAEVQRRCDELKASGESALALLDGVENGLR